jgi:hypothetical protein
VSRTDYWVTIKSGKGTCGAGFLLTRRYVLTAAHCLRNKADEDDRVTVSRNADQAEGRVIEINHRRDVALIQILGTLGWTVLPVCIDRCIKGDRWLSPYRPATSQSELKGHVLTSPAEFRCQGGDLIEALELEVRQLIGQYRGYSGSPVERDGDDDMPDGRPIVGMLIEQDLHRVRISEATNVLFAVTVQYAIDTFDAIKAPAQHSRLCPKHTDASQAGQASSADCPEPVRKTPPAFFNGARWAIDEIKALVKEGYLPVSDSAELIRDVVREAARAAVKWGDNGEPTR